MENKKDKKQITVNVFYGDMKLVDCMTNVIKRHKLDENVLAQ